MENIQGMLNKMGGGGNKKVNTSAMQAHLERNLKLAKQKERMVSNIGKGAQTAPKFTPDELLKMTQASDNASKDLLESIYRNGPKAERSSINKPKNKGKKKK